MRLCLSGRRSIGHLLFRQELVCVFRYEITETTGDRRDCRQVAQSLEDRMIDVVENGSSESTSYQGQLHCSIKFAR